MSTFLHNSARLHRRLGRALALTTGLMLATAFLTPETALAQSRKPKAARSVTFEDDVIEANYLRPDVASIDTKSKDKRASLIRIRTNFYAELYRSAEDL